MKTRIIVIAMVSCMMALVATSSASGASGQLIGGSGFIDNGRYRNANGRVIEPEEMEDILLFAEQHGVPPEQALQRYSWHLDFASYAADLRRKYPERFAGAAINGQGHDQDAVVLFSDGVPSDVVDDPRVKGLNINYVEGVGYSERSLEQTSDRVRDALLESGFFEFQLLVDVRSGSVEGQVAVRDPNAHSLDEERSELPQEARDPRVNLEVVKDVDAGLDSLLGGGRLEWPNSGSLKCTAGFAVNVGWWFGRGFSTAGHCTTPFTQENVSGGQEYDSQRTTTGSPNYGDLRVYETSQWESDDFYNGWSSTRDLQAVGSPVSGQMVCRFGHASGTWCDEVMNTYATNSCCGTTYSDLVEMVHEYADPGDSGGPWFLGRTAFGIHHGYRWNWGYRDLFTPVENLPIALSAAVMTS